LEKELEAEDENLKALSHNSFSFLLGLSAAAGWG